MWRHMNRKKWNRIFTACLLAFTAWLSLDTFVFASVYQEDATQMNLSMFEASAERADQEASEEKDGQEASEALQAAADTADDTGLTDQTKEKETTETILTETISTENSYQDENISVTITEYTWYDTQVYVADVVLSSAEYLKTAFAQDSYGKNITQVTSEQADTHDAVLAVNGDNYGSQEKGYVIRNGIVYRDTAGSGDVLCVYADGSMQIVDPSEYTAQELVSMGVWQAFSFGPALLEDGTVSVTQDQEVGKAKASNPRTAIGIIDDLHYVFVVSDGRTDESEGLSLYELAEFMQNLGVTTAYNLDGGGSSTMVFQGEVVNNPTSNGRIKEREVNDIVYIG